MERYVAKAIVVSDRAASGARVDATGPRLAETLEEFGFGCAEILVLPDDERLIAEALRSAVRAGFDLIVTSGGTGFGPRDVTPEATLKILDKRIDGVTQAMLFNALKTNPRAMLSRALAGISGKSIVVNLPGSPKGAIEDLRFVLPVLRHGLCVLSGRAKDCGA